MSFMNFQNGTVPNGNMQYYNSNHNSGDGGNSGGEDQQPGDDVFTQTMLSQLDRQHGPDVTARPVQTTERVLQHMRCSRARSMIRI